jgi:hypothetical protein
MKKLTQLILLAAIAGFALVSCKSESPKPAASYTPPPDNGKPINHIPAEVRAATGMDRK